MRDHHYFDGYIRHRKTFPQGYVDTPEGRVWLADSEEPIYENGRIFYRTIYGVGRDNKAEFAADAEYELHETGGSHTERDARLSEAVVEARKRIKILMDSGYFDDDRKGHFSPRP